MLYAQNFTALMLSLQTVSISSPLFMIPLHSLSSSYYSFHNMNILRSIPSFLLGTRFKSAYISGSRFSYFISTVISINSESNCQKVIANSSTPDVHIFNCSFNGINDGSIKSTNNSLRIFSCNFSNSFSESGGAVYHTNGYLSSNNCNYMKNKAKSTGGAIYHAKGDFYLYRSSFHSNYAPSYDNFYAQLNESLNEFYINFCFFGKTIDTTPKIIHRIEPPNCTIIYSYCKFPFSQEEFSSYSNNTNKFNGNTNVFDLSGDVFMHKAPSTYFTNSIFFTLSSQFSESYGFTESSDFTKSSDFVPTLDFSKSLGFIQTPIFTNTHSFTATSAFSSSSVFSESIDFTVSMLFTKSSDFKPSLAFKPSLKFATSQIFSNSLTFTPMATQTPSISPIPTKSPKPSSTPSNSPSPTAVFKMSLEFTQSKSLSFILPKPPPAATPTQTAVPRVLSFSPLGIVMTVLGVSIAVIGLIANGILCAYMAQAGEIIITQQI